MGNLINFTATTIFNNQILISMKELVITENVEFQNFSSESVKSYTFPNIQKHLDDGFTIKNIFYSPLSNDGVYGVSITAHLQKSE